MLFTIFISHQKAKFITATSIFSILGRISVSLLALRLGFGVIGVIVVSTVFSYLSLLVNLFFLKRYILVPHWEFDWPFLLKMLQRAQSVCSADLVKRPVFPVGGNYPLIDPR